MDDCQLTHTYDRFTPDLPCYWRHLEALSLPNVVPRGSPFCSERFVQRSLCLLQVHPSVATPPKAHRAACHEQHRSEPRQKGRAKVESVRAYLALQPTGQRRREATSSNQCDIRGLRRLLEMLRSASRASGQYRLYVGWCYSPCRSGHMYWAELFPPFTQSNKSGANQRAEAL
jgi:hypothetical protein